MSSITVLETYDVRFPTSRELDGSDAMNPDPDYSAAYGVLRTDATTPDGTPLDGHGFAFTIGRGNDVQVAALRLLEPYVVGLDLDTLCTDPGALSARLVNDSQLRWLGPEKGVMHMAIGAVVNAAWDLAAKRAGLPLWRLLAGMSPEQLLAVVDFRYLTDALTPAEALDILRRGQEGKAERIAELEASGYPAYTTSPGWLGYSDEKLTRLARQAVATGSPRSSSRSAPTSTTTCAGSAPPGRWSGPTSGSPSTRTSGGASTRRSPGCESWPPSTRGGSRSRPAPTTCSATRRSDRRSRR